MLVVVMAMAVVVVVMLMAVMAVVMVVMLVPGPVFFIYIAHTKNLLYVGTKDST
jgi:hypothetical protein